MPITPIRWRAVASGAALIPLMALAGCAPPAAVGAIEDNSSGTATPDASDAAEYTVDNCGTEVAFDAPPSRVVTIKSTSTEMLLALGLGDRIVGSSFSDGSVPGMFAGEASPPVLAENIPSQEVILVAMPDLVYGGWESNFSADGAGSRVSYQRLGVNTLVSPAACRESGYRPQPLTFDRVFEEISQVGAIFGVQDAAARLTGIQREELAAVHPSEAGMTALWYSSGSDTPYVGAGIGAPQMIMDAAGLINIAADVDDSWSSLSWEVVVDRNPDVIVLIDSSWGSVQKKIGVLEANPATAQLDAVVHKRYLVLPFASSEAGVRSVSAVSSLVAQLAALGSAG